MSPDSNNAERRVLVTGASGFLGRTVVTRLLETGWTVDALTSAVSVGRAAPDLEHEALRWHEADLLDASSVDGLVGKLEATFLMHLAWVRARPIYNSPDNLRWVAASAHLLEAFLQNGGRRTVFAGSSAEYDWSAGVCREKSTPLAGGGVYGASKRALAELFQGQFEAHNNGESPSGVGASGAWARIFFLFGPHEAESRLVAAVAKALITGEPVRCSDGTQVRDYMYVEDAADALVSLLASDVSGPINIASGEGIRVRDLVLELAERVGDGAERIEWGAAGQSSEEAPLVVADVGRLRDELGWQPSVGRSRGLDRTLAWWRERLAPIAPNSGV